MTDHPYPTGPDGMYVDPRGTRFSARQAEAIADRRAAETAAAVKAREESEAAAATEREQQRRADGQKRLEQYRQSCLVKWTDNGGTETGFATAWPTLRDKWLADQLGDRVTEDVARLRSQPLYQI